MFFIRMKIMDILVIVSEQWNWAAVQFNQFVISGHNDGPRNAAVTERTWKKGSGIHSYASEAGII